MATLRDQVQAFRRQRMRAALHRHKGNVTRAAKALGVDRSYVYRVLRWERRAQ
jgi:transcriptional regulator of acetoin/glycerol metabolism